ncbi:MULTISPECIES: GcrA family cell cycle regulator [unclassified Bradyrhizobium]|uniref:GcrA family cell cycle regulator n=1 Tax=unclassified Bradyrhizobium TaxID=2631580 RepID=UPI0028E97011|nr:MULTISPECIES: GcrA family cell cycle regulator [unclassified Bradyrhizobium]
MTFETGPWADERLFARVKELYKTFSAAETAKKIGAEFGVRLTTNSILGKLKRAGITKGRVGGVKVAKHDLKPRTPKSSAPITTPPPRPAASRVVDFSPRNITLLKLQANECRYECSGQQEAAKFTFCGNPTVMRNGAACSYCARHAEICLLDAVPRKSKAAVR